MVSVGIIGVTGYAGGELVRLLSRHEGVRLLHVASESNLGQPLAKAFPGLAGTAPGRLVCEGRDIVRIARDCDAVFLAQESGAAMTQAGEILDLGKRVIDLSADFRLRDETVYEEWYKIEHQAAQYLHEGAVYGLPELNRQYVTGARLVANPGCYPTSAILALAPLLREKLIGTHSIVIDGKSGVSGAGRARNDLSYRYSEANEATRPYNIGGAHRHTPEIEQELSVHGAPDQIRVTFTPHLVPMTRGLLTTCYAHALTDAVTTETVLAALRKQYADAPFVVVRDANDYPSTKDVYGSNYCHIGAKVDARTRTVVVTSVIDNLVKGAAGQAVQNMNLMCGLDETQGLEGTGLWP